MVHCPEDWVISTHMLLAEHNGTMIWKNNNNDISTHMLLAEHNRYILLYIISIHPISGN